MLARIEVFLPFILHILENSHFKIQAIKIAGYNVRFFPPRVTDEIEGSSEISIGNNRAFPADTLILELQKAEFERALTAAPDPPQEVVNQIINWVINRLRFVSSSPDVRPLVSLEDINWELKYLNDDGTGLEKREGLSRGYGVEPVTTRTTAITPEIWEDAFNLPPGFQIPHWKTLLLEAEHMLPKLGPAVVLTHTALEVFIYEMLRELALRQKMSVTFSAWITAKNKFRHKPAIADQFDTLLKEVCGVSLKSNTDLWEAFKNLKNVRNNFVHDGHLTLSQASDRPISLEDARQLIFNAQEIVEFVREHLPEDMKWPKFEHKFDVVAKVGKVHMIFKPSTSI